MAIGNYQIDFIGSAPGDLDFIFIVSIQTINSNSKHLFFYFLLTLQNLARISFKNTHLFNSQTFTARHSEKLFLPKKKMITKSLLVLQNTHKYF